MPKKKPVEIDTEKTIGDTTYDEIVLEDENLGISDKIQKLQKKLKECEKERQEYLDGWQRARADLVNKEKDAAEVRTRTAKRAEENVFIGLFPALDSFDMAFSNKAVWESVDKNWRIGIEHIYAQIIQIFKDAGISVIDEVGIGSDPYIHEPIETTPVDSKEEDGHVYKVIQKGYRTSEYVLRPAKVIIGKFSE